MIQLETIIAVAVTERTTWTFANFVNDDGVKTTVEITSSSFISEVVANLTEMASMLRECDMESDVGIESRLGLTVPQIKENQAIAIAVSGLRSAIIQLRATARQVPLTEALGGNPTQSVQLYANINRSLFKTDRSPAAYFKVAEKARNAGFKVFKCAPFDEVSALTTQSTIAVDSALGLERVTAVRNAIGPDAKLLVDCHSRFRQKTVQFIVDPLLEMDVAWLEEPVQPINDLEEFLKIARTVPIPVAGGENAYGTDLFHEMFTSKADVIAMPDVKHCGGVCEAVKIGHDAIAHGAGFSLHSPSGPISLLTSAHVAATVEGSMPLEHAVYEADWRTDILKPPEIIEQGQLWIPPGSGLGATLNYTDTKRFTTVWAQ